MGMYDLYPSIISTLNGKEDLRYISTVNGVHFVQRDSTLMLEMPLVDNWGTTSLLTFPKQVIMAILLWQVTPLPYTSAQATTSAAHPAAMALNMSYAASQLASIPMEILPAHMTMTLYSTALFFHWI